MKHAVKILLSLLLCAVITAGTCLCAAAEDTLTTDSLRFCSDGHFKILHVTDTHLHDCNVRNTVRLIALACDTEKPDLAVLTGDLASEDTYAHTAKLTDNLMQVFESRKIPVAVTFGNHDSENGAYTRESVMALYRAYACCVAVDDGEALTGCGTYRIPILSSDGKELRLNVWMFDSGSYDSEGHYANVAADQVAWYRETSAALERENGRKIPSLAFQHIIVPQVYDALEQIDLRLPFSYPHMYPNGKYYRFSSAGKNYGMLSEKPCCGYCDHGQFDTMTERGDVRAIFTGHDHTNAFGVQYKGIDLVNSLSTRYERTAFSTQYGYRIIELREDAADTYETHVVHWYDFVNAEEVKQLADSRSDKSLLSQIRFLGFFRKSFTDLCVFFAETFTGRTVRYPD